MQQDMSMDDPMQSSGQVEQPMPGFTDVHIPPDMTLLVSRSEIPIAVHRQLLINHSPYVATLCKKVRGLTRIRVHDLEVPEVMSLLKLIYMGKLEVEEANMMSHLRAAKYFQMKEYFTACSNLITVHNVLLFVNMTTDESVAQKVWSIIDEQAVQVLQSPLFSDLTPTNVIAVIERDSLQASEMQVYEACIKWAESEIRKNKLNVTGKVIRKVLDRILLHVRFPLMDPLALALITDEKSRQYYKVLTDQEALSVFRAIHTKDQSATLFSLKPRNHSFAHADHVIPASDNSSQ